MAQEIFEANESENVHAVIAWIPMLDTDNLEAANEREAQFSDPRVKQLWDKDRIWGRLLSQAFNLKGCIAWDVCLVYLLNHSWNGELPPMPNFWMHPLDEEPSFLLDPPRLKEYLVPF